MSAAELHANALARVGELRSVSDAGTERPWVRDGGWSVVSEPPEGWSGPHMVVDCGVRNDAALIVAAVNAFKPLLGMVEAVLERHRPDGNFCAGCGTPKVLYSWKSCPDARAALTALGIEADA